jgi:hypothetical protein
MVGKVAKKEAPAPTTKPRKPHKLPKFRKSTEAERRKAVADYEALLAEVRKMKLSPGNAVEWIREDRSKDYN